MDKSMHDILDDMSISPEAKQALLLQEGEMGQALACVLAIEQARDKEVYFMNLSLGDISMSYVDAISWATHALASLEK
jgi:c-di-GMP-related signal transduction protein